MLRSIAFLFLIVSPAITHAQLFGPQQIISTLANGPYSVASADLDGDGDLDVLSASSFDDKIAWYANDGSGGFGPQQIISTSAVGAICVASADLDGDGDLDVLSASSTGTASKIAWYVNDGSGGFGPEQIISTLAFGASWVATADLDGDGDLDVLSASSFDGKIAWYGNDGSGGFGPQQIISNLADEAQCVASADLDGDGDLDVLSASRLDDEIAWYANDGSGGFGPQQIISNGGSFGAFCVASADLDGDGDLDVLSASISQQPMTEVAWYANDGSGGFGPQQIISTPGARCVATADLDGDGDIDVLSTSGSALVRFANDGSGGFGPQQIISTLADGAYSVASADLDGDGDLDVLSASYGDDKIAWYENLTLVTAVPTVAAEQVALYPNPMSASATVLLDQTRGAAVLEFFDMQGRSIRTVTQAVQERRIIVPRDGLKPGPYLLRITGEKRSEAKLFVE
ncbi:MAG: T9SS type A sorting domain-containing protein [Flavobacteriales bacterium]|nr:T9SS type A sorting domain-containing protein [Flavobacteriales bacterium]